MPKKVLIIKKDNVVFTELVDNEEPALFGDSEESLNSFKEDQKLFEIDSYLNKQQHLANLDKTSIKTSHDLENKDNQIWKEIYLNKLRNDKLALEQLLDDLESLKEERCRTGKLNYGSKIVKTLKQKLIYLLYKQCESNQLIRLGKDKEFSSNDEYLRFANYLVKQKNLQLRIDKDCKLNCDLNLYLKLNLENELILAKILKNLNIQYDGRDQIERYIECFKLKLKPKLLIYLFNLQTKFNAIDRLLKLNSNKYNRLLQRYFEIIEQKELLKYRYYFNEMQLVEKFRIEIKRIHINNLNLTNKINMLERNFRRVQSKL